MDYTELPKLPKGMGGYDYYKGKIRYKKRLRHENQFKDTVVYGDTIQEVNRKMKEKENEFVKIAKKEIVALKTRTLEEGMLQWLQDYKRHEIKDKSYDRIETTYNCHVKNTDIGRMQEKAIETSDLQKYLTRIKRKDGRQLSYSGKKKVYELYAQYFRFLYADAPQTDPMLRVSKPRKDDDSICEEEMTVYSDEEMFQLQALAMEEYHNGISGYKWGLAVTFLMWSFMRVNECLALQMKDIDTEEWTVNIYKQFSTVQERDDDGLAVGRVRKLTKPKRHSIRKIKLSQPAIEALQTYLARNRKFAPEEFIFSNPGEEFPIVENALRQAHEGMRDELMFSKRLTIHDLRHCGISFMLRHEVPVEVVSRMAGHKSINITYDVYYSVIEKQRTDAIDILNENLKKGNVQS